MEGQRMRITSSRMARISGVVILGGQVVRELDGVLGVGHLGRMKAPVDMDDGLPPRASCRASSSVSPPGCANRWEISRYRSTFRRFSGEEMRAITVGRPKEVRPTSTSSTRSLDAASCWK